MLRRFTIADSWRARGSEKRFSPHRRRTGVSEVRGSALNPIAVVGVGCRLPGGIASADKLWDALLRGDDFVTEVPLDRWDPQEMYDPEPGVPGYSVSKWGAFLDDVAGFDAEFFGISEREAEAIDPQHRLLLETSWEAIEHAGIDPVTLSESATGVFVGMTHGDYQLVAADAGVIEGPYGFTGSNFSLASGRIAYRLGLKGPAYTVDSACSSSLLAVHLACRSLQDGESDLALAGGVSITLESRKMSSGSAQGMLSPTGRCRAFDAAADGFVLGEAAVMFLFKRLDDAVRDGDRVLALVRGTAANQDGHTINIATPSADAQVDVYRSALQSAGLDGSTVGYVEAHGTGTPVGDPLEFNGLAKVYGTDGRCVLGSVKTNLGHAQSAAGAVGMMKAILALEHGIVPKNLHFTRLAAELEGIESGLFVPEAPTEWPQNTEDPRRAAVSSYGLSGTNVHIVLEQAPVGQASEAAGGAVGTSMNALEEPVIFALSSTSAEALCETAGRMADWVAERADAVDISDLAYTLMERRSHRPVRTVVLARSHLELVNELRAVADGAGPYVPAVGNDVNGPVWVFSGQGSQWAGMGSALLASEPVFAATVAEIEPLIAHESGFSVTEAMLADETPVGIDRVQPTVFAVQVALAATMKSYGVTPGAVIGHSMGEAAAAFVAGGLSLEDAVKVICRRSRLMASIAGSGAMASVELPAAQVLNELSARGVNDVVLSVVASPTSTVVGGAKDSIRKLVAAWEQGGVMAREVAVDVASHSPEVDPILDDLLESLEDLTPLEPTVPYYSATLYDPRDEPYLDADYWADNLRHTVRFAAAVQAALEDGYRVFAELSPHPLLTHAVDQTARSLDVPLAALAPLRREQELPHGLRDFLGDLYSVGAAVDFAAMFPAGRLVDAPLPSWTNVPLMLTRDAHDQHSHGGQMVAVHPLLGAHVCLPEDPERHVWQAEVGTATHEWLDDHRVRDVAEMPASAYCEMALAASRTLLGAQSTVCDLSFDEPLILAEETAISASAVTNGAGAFDLTIQTHQPSGEVQHAAATLRVADVDTTPAAHEISGLMELHPHRIEGGEVQQSFSTRGVEYGPAFAGLAAVNFCEGPARSVLASVTLPSAIRSQQSAYAIHPALLDACFQAVDAHPDVQEFNQGFLPIPSSVREMRAYAPTRNAHYCYARIIAIDPAGDVEADLEVLDPHGNVLVALRGVTFRALSAEVRRNTVLNERLLGIDWLMQQAPEAEQPAARTILLVNTFDSAGAPDDEMVAALKALGAEVVAMDWPIGADPDSQGELLRSHLDERGCGAIVIRTGHERRGPNVAAEGAAYVRHITRIVRNLPEVEGLTARLFVVTRNAQSVLADDAVNLELAGLRGLIRVVGTEMPHQAACQIDVDDRTSVELVVRQLLSDSEEDETAWRDGQWYVARMTPAPLTDADRRRTEADWASDGVRMQIRTPGDLETLELVAIDRVAPGPGQIEVMVRASSINFADVLVAFGRYPRLEDRLPQLGTDFAGVVTAVGPNVTSHSVGDRVGGLSGNGCWGNFVTCDAAAAVTLPAELSDPQAAAATTAYATAWYGLHELARIKSGDRVLIHSATGGVGQAAVAIARNAGAEIFATAGSDGRRELLREWGIKHVYDSRSTSFADEIRRDTGGYGVDIVLNSATGARQAAGLELLAFGGSFVEIGKRDIYADTRIGLFPFRRNLSLYAVDLALLTVTDPELVGDLLARLYARIAQGELPVPEFTVYAMSEAGVALGEMSGARHTGKLILAIPTEGDSRAVVAPECATPFRRDASYIITGGMGGLGLFLAEKMAVEGCGRIVLNGRSAPDSDALQVIERIRMTGTDVHVERGDIAEPATAQRLVEAAMGTGLPLRGVLHAAALVEDATISNITDELIDRDWAPKAAGAWNLHLATETADLDWFCSFSSAAAMVGSPGQGAYAAANSWVDGFTRWRRAQGLPATAIAWGAWSAIGAGQAMAEKAEGAIEPAEGAYAFETLLRYDRAYTGYAPILGSPWLMAFAQRSRFAEAFRSLGQKGNATNKFLAELRGLPKEEWAGKLRHFVSEQVSLILRRSVDPDRPLAEYGLDSLGNLEVRTRIETETGIRISPADISTVRSLAAHLCEMLAAEGAGAMTS